MTDRKIVASSHSDQPEPDEEHLKKLWDAEVLSIESEFEAAAEQAKRRQAALEPLLAATGSSQQKIDEEFKAARGRSEAAMAKAKRKMAAATVDFEALRRQELELIQRNAAPTKSSGNPSYNGDLTDVTNAGVDRVYTSGSNEVAEMEIYRPENRISALTRAYGAGYFDADLSIANGYLGFTLYPPTWGNLRVTAQIHLAGRYYLYADDEWYNSEYAKAEIATWCKIHQVFWRDTEYNQRWSLGGSELHGSKYYDLNATCLQECITNVGSNNPVTIKLGVRLKSYARANGSRAELDFSSGSFQIWIPKVHWDVRH